MLVWKWLWEISLQSIIWNVAYLSGFRSRTNGKYCNNGQIWIHFMSSSYYFDWHISWTHTSFSFTCPASQSSFCRTDVLGSAPDLVWAHPLRVSFSNRTANSATVSIVGCIQSHLGLYSIAERISLFSRRNNGPIRELIYSIFFYCFSASLWFLIGSGCCWSGCTRVFFSVDFRRPFCAWNCVRFSPMTYFRSLDIANEQKI